MGGGGEGGRGRVGDSRSNPLLTGEQASEPMGMRSCLDVSSAKPFLIGCNIALPHSAPSDARLKNPRSSDELPKVPRAPEPARRALSTPFYHLQYQPRNDSLFLSSPLIYLFSLAVRVSQHNSTRHSVIFPVPARYEYIVRSRFFSTSFLPSFLPFGLRTNLNARPCKQNTPWIAVLDALLC